MKRINKKSEIPAWFSINNYFVINELTDSELIDQLIVRRDSIKSHDKDDDDENFFCEHPELKDEIFSWNEKRLSCIVRPLDSATFYEEKMSRKRYSDLQMTGMGGVDPLRLIDVISMAKKADVYISKNDIKRSLRGQKRSVSKTICSKNEMIINIDLSWPDEILIRDIITLLPIWRKELNHNKKHEDKISNGWDVIKKKLLDYKIIPLLDLIEWSRMTNTSITNRVLALALFPDGEYDSTNIAQTIKPFIENLFAEFSLEKLKRKIIKDF